MTQTSMALALAGFSFMMAVIWGPPLLTAFTLPETWETNPHGWTRTPF